MDSQSRRVSIVVVGLLIAFLAIRSATIPRDPSVTKAFSHDSAYICIIAEQLLAGQGYTNPAHWLVFLNPPKLPMPYHNANPGYPTAIAAMALPTGKDNVARAGLMVNILFSGLLATFTYLLVKAYRLDWKVALAAAVASLLHPVVWQYTYSVLPDTMMTALSVGVIFLLCARIPWPWSWIAAGALFGFAWLVRSTAILLIPPILFGVIRRDGFRRAVPSFVLFLVAAGVVASPWLIHTQRVWGSPFRSDAGFYWLLNYYAAPFGGNVLKFFHSMTPPPTLGEILRTDLGGFTTNLVQSIPELIYRFVRGISAKSKSYLVILAFGFASTLWLGRRQLKTWEWQAGALLLFLNSLALLPRANTAEIRYFMVSIVLIAIWIAVQFCEGVKAWKDGRATTLDKIAVLLLICTAIGSVKEDVRASQDYVKTNPERLQIREIARKVVQITSKTPVVLEDPYFYTFYTHGVSALQAPYTDKPHLLTYMDRYGARFLLVKDDELADMFTVQNFPFEPEFSARERLDDYTLWERN